jgi:hypothetical protein
VNGIEHEMRLKAGDRKTSICFDIWSQEKKEEIAKTVFKPERGSTANNY